MGSETGKKYFVTGVAGFIGSHLAETLLSQGHSVIGMDTFTPYYSRDIKEKNLESFKSNPQFTFLEDDVLTAINLSDIIAGVDAVFHEAAQAGVLYSWGKDFDKYTQNNILATQRILEACKDTHIKKLVFASSSSVYGNATQLPMSENQELNPISPYGLTKLACEHLCRIYNTNFSVPVICLRYFTVYGPRQRPDMAINKFFNNILTEKPIDLYGDGSQTRDFTYVSDIVDATIAASECSSDFEIMNIGGGSTVTVKELITHIESLSGKTALINHIDNQKGDMKHTHADISKAKKIIQYEPKVSLEKGLDLYLAWLKGQSS